MAASDDFYLDILGEVDSVVAELGTTYKVRGSSTYDPDTLTRGSTAERDVVGLVASGQVAHSLGSIAFPVTETSAAWIETKTLILTAAANPRPEEEVLVDGHWFPLSKVKPIKPAEITVVYLLNVSR